MAHFKPHTHSAHARVQWPPSRPLHSFASYHSSTLPIWLSSSPGLRKRAPPPTRAKAEPSPLPTMLRAARSPGAASRSLSRAWTSRVTLRARCSRRTALLRRVITPRLRPAPGCRAPHSARRDVPSTTCQWACSSTTRRSAHATFAPHSAAPQNPAVAACSVSRVRLHTPSRWPVRSRTPRNLAAQQI